MNRTLKESLTGGRNVTVGSLHRRGPGHKDSDDKLDLFAKNRRTLSVASSDESDVSVKLGRLSVGSVKLTRNGVDDLLSSTDGGKHDYDWLLTPPETPLTSSDGSETRPSLTAPRRGSLNRSASTAKTSSRLSVTHSESNNSSRPVRSSSVTRSSVSVSYNTHYNNSSTSYTNKSTSILNTSSSSVSSYSRPSTPTRSSSSIARPSTPSSRSISSRSSTPSRTRPGPSNSSSSIDRTKPSQATRPQIPAITNSLTSRTVSRPSTPTRRNPPPSTTNLSPASTSNVRFPTSSLSSSRPSSPNKQARPTASSSRPCSPSSRPRPTAPLVLPDFPLDTPPNLRTSLPPDRPLSAGRSRPGSVVTSKVNVEASTPSNLTRRQSSSPIRRLSEPNSTRGRLHGNGQATDAFDSNHSSSRKPIKSSSYTTTSMENNGFGRNISKKSMDMAMRHMDIRLSGSSLFPQSIRSGNNNTKGGQAIHVSNGNVTSLYENGHILEKGDYASYRHENGNGNYERLSVRTSEPEFYESSQYDAILLKEDLKNTNWLHSIDDKSDQGSIFDHGFEPLPEPFDPL